MLTDARTAKIPVLDLTPEIEELWNELNEAFQSVLRSGRFILGPNVKAFEHEVATYLGVKHAIGVASGTDALVIGLRALGVGPGDEVITTPFTFVATAEAISNVGAKPIFVDIDGRTFNIDPDLVEEKITDKTKALIPVHLYGQACHMDRIMAIAKKYDLKILEDVAQAFGGEHRGRKLGTIGDAGALSFFPSKNLGALGDAGLVATNDDEVAEMCRMLRAHGSRKKYYNEVVGYNSRLDEVQAAVLRVKLKHVDERNEGRRKGAARYDELLNDGRGLGIVPPHCEPRAKHVYHQYTVCVLNGRRDEVYARLQRSGIGAMVYYPVPVHRLPVYGLREGTCPVAEEKARQVLSLPIWPAMDTEVQEHVAAAVRDPGVCVHASTP